MAFPFFSLVVIEFGEVVLIGLPVEIGETVAVHVAPVAGVREQVDAAGGRIVVAVVAVAVQSDFKGEGAICVCWHGSLLRLGFPKGLHEFLVARFYRITQPRLVFFASPGI